MGLDIKVEMMKVSDLTLHDLALTTPVMSGSTFEALKANIDTEGQLEPVALYRGKIVDGRHRWLILQELGIEDIKVTKLPNNTTLDKLKSLVFSKELRRHETTAQLAIRAYRMMAEGKLNQGEASDLVGVARKQVGLAKKIAIKYNRPDILELLFSGLKFKNNTKDKPHATTDSLSAIITWLEIYGVAETTKEKFVPRIELTEEEQLVAVQWANVLGRESILVRKEALRIAYINLKEAELAEKEINNID